MKKKQINFVTDDELYSEVLNYAKRNDLSKSAAARELVCKGLGKEQIRTTVTDTIDVDLTRRVERLEAKQEEKSWIKRKLGI